MKKTSEDAGGAVRSGPLDRFLSAFSLVSRLPLRASFTFDPSRLDFWLPIVGLPVALLAGGLLALLSLSPLPAMAIALCVLAIQYLAFNLFHLDGLLDTADAFLGAIDREKRLAVLKDSRIGVYAFFVGFFYLAAKVHLLAGLASALGSAMKAAQFGRPTIALFGALAYPIAGRTAAAFLPAILVPARAGLGALAKDSKATRAALGGLLALALWAGLCTAFVLLLGAPDPVPLAPLILPWLAAPISAVLSAVVVARIYRKGLGGYTGDALGAAVELGELCHLALVSFVFLSL